MYRILLVGKMERILEELYRSLERRYHVQLCPAEESVEVVRTLTQIVKPDMVVLNTLEEGDVNAELFPMIRTLYGNMPILTIGTQENCEYYQKYFDGTYVAPLFRPVAVSVIMERCARMLGDKNPTEDVEPEAEAIECEKKRILIVDDSAVTLRSVKALLDKEYHISVATSGEMAVKSMKKNAPDLVLLDYEMPICDGRQTFEMIRNDEQIKDIPVVFLTAVADKKHIAAVLQLSPAGYILKPPDREGLKETIKNVLKKSTT